MEVVKLRTHTKQLRRNICRLFLSRPSALSLFFFVLGFVWTSSSMLCVESIDLLFFLFFFDFVCPFVSAINFETFLTRECFSSMHGSFMVASNVCWWERGTAKVTIEAECGIDTIVRVLRLRVLLEAVRSKERCRAVCASQLFAVGVNRHQNNRNSTNLTAFLQFALSKNKTFEDLNNKRNDKIRLTFTCQCLHSTFSATDSAK